MDKAKSWYRDPWEWALRLGIYGLCTFGVLSAFLRDAEAWKGFWDSVSGQTAAAWVQAFGSIAAIIGAVVVSQRQIAAGREDARRAAFFQTVKQYVAMRVVASRVAGYCKIQLANFSLVEPTKVASALQLVDFFQYEEYKRLIQGFDLVNMPRPGLIGRMSDLAGYLDAASRAIATANAAAFQTPDWAKRMWHTLRLQNQYAMDEAISIYHSCNDGLHDMGAEDFIEALPEMLKGDLSAMQADMELKAGELNAKLG